MTPAWLAAAHQSANGPALGRVVLVAVAALAVGAFAVLQLRARRQAPRRPPGPSDWRAMPPLYWPEGRDDEMPPGNAERRRPDWRYGYPPGYEPYPLYDQARSPWTVRDQAGSDLRS